MPHSTGNTLFDPWADQYDAWFRTPIGTWVKQYESRLLLDFLQPDKDESILDVGCGTGIFTRDILAYSPRVIGLDPSLPMLEGAVKKTGRHTFFRSQGICWPCRSGTACLTNWFP